MVLYPASVEVSKDLRYAVSCQCLWQSAEQRQQLRRFLRTGYIRSELGKRIRLRHTPEITFKLDESIERGARLIALIEKVRGKDDSGNE